MTIEDCKKCGGTHYGSNKCPFTDAEIAAMRAQPEADSAEILSSERSTSDRPRDETSSSSSTSNGRAAALDAAPSQSHKADQALEALAFAEGAILDAIGLEEGLDGRAGEAVLKMIRAALIANGQQPITIPPEDEPGDPPYQTTEQRLAAALARSAPAETVRGLATELRQEADEAIEASQKHNNDPYLAGECDTLRSVADRLDVLAGESAKVDK